MIVINAILNITIKIYKEKAFFRNQLSAELEFKSVNVDTLT